jgi:hypothetical protein
MPARPSRDGLLELAARPHALPLGGFFLVTLWLGAADEIVERLKVSLQAKMKSSPTSVRIVSMGWQPNRSSPR